MPRNPRPKKAVKKPAPAPEPPAAPSHPPPAPNVVATILPTPKSFEKIVLDAAKPTIMIGRSSKADYRIQHPEVSGTHCSITLTGNNLILEDTSTNGTCVQGPGAAARSPPPPPPPSPFGPATRSPTPMRPSPGTSMASSSVATTSARCATAR